MTRATSFLLGMAVIVLTACGDSPAGVAGATCTPGTTAAFTITSAGLTAPKAVCVLPAGSVTFRNNDTVAHDIQGDAVNGAACAPVSVGSIPASGTAVATFPTAVVCAFHDAGAPTNIAFQGTVAVTSVTVGGGGGGGAGY